VAHHYLINPINPINEVFKVSTNFNWKTEEERWDDAPVFHEEVEQPRKRWWPQALVVLLIVAAVGILLYWQVRRQLDAAVARTENDVHRVHELVLQAADNSDRDLLNNMMSARNEAWLYQQLELAGEGLLYNPRPFGLVSQPESVPQHEFVLSADLNEAEVFTTRTFTVQSPTGVSETVALEQYAVYRRSEDRWIFAPPRDLAAFWGDSITKEGQYLTITYPMRDAEAVQPLFQYLDTKLGEMCTTLPNFSCPDNLRVYLDLETDPASQAELIDSVTMFDNDPDLTLPTLTLVGIPVDEAAQDALYRGYAAHVVRTAMINALDWECCERGLFFRALLDYQLAELGLRPYPLHPADYEDLFGRFRQLDDLGDLWTARRIGLSDSIDWQWVYALTEFVLTTPLSAQTAGTMQQSLTEFGAYLNWINDKLTGTVADRTIQHAWLNFIYGRSLSGQVAEGEFIPQQKILLACESGFTTFLHRYDWASNEWVTLDRFDQATLFMASTPNDSAVIFQGSYLESSSTLFVWQDGQTTTLLDSSTPEMSGFYFIGLMAPDGRKLTMTRFGEEGYLLLDLEECSNTGCQLYTISGLPEWSPDGSQMILELLQQTENTRENVGLSRIDKAGQVAHVWGQGSAFAPFWLGEEEYGYIQSGEQAGVYAALVADDEPQLLLSGEDLLQTLPEDERPDSFAIQEVLPNPANRNILAITTYFRDQNGDGSHLFLWNRPSGELTLVASLDQVFAGLAVWLSNGEWLSVPTFPTSSPVGGLNLTYSYYLYHVSGEGESIVLTPNQDLGFQLPDRSIDGRWLLLLNNRYIELVAPNQTITGNRPYRRLLTHNFNNCHNALFIG
jgi:hypothetical protein